MRSWSSDHPKAKLMARKRAAILEAARDAFLTAGFEGASMESIAAGAGVSIMTVYRHARTKDALFAAVVSEACSPDADSEEGQAIDAVLKLPLEDILTFAGTRIAERLRRPQTLGLLRAVMLEHGRSPNLGRMAYQGLVASHARALEAFLATRPEASALAADLRAEMVAEFVDRLVGADLLRALLGVAPELPFGLEHRARSAAALLVAHLHQLTAVRR